MQQFSIQLLSSETVSLNIETPLKRRATGNRRIEGSFNSPIFLRLLRFLGVSKVFVSLSILFQG
jgi:hypothetical protein